MRLYKSLIKNKTVLVSLIVLLAFIAIFIIMGHVFTDPFYEEYKAGKAYYDDKMWIEAVETFKNLGDYKDSKEILKELSKKPISELYDSFEVGDIVFFGMYFDQPLYWRVLNVNKGRALLITNYLIEARAPNADDRRAWENSYVKPLLNKLFSDLILSKEQWDEIELTKIKAFHTGMIADSKIFLLDAREAEYYFRTPKERVAQFYPGANNGIWMLRSCSGCSDRYDGFYSIVGKDGNMVINTFPAVWDDVGIRPAMWVKIPGEAYEKSETDLTEETEITIYTPEVSPDKSRVDDSVIFDADSNIRLIDLSKAENRKYKDWLDDRAKKWEKWINTDKHYLTEQIHILEENDNLYFVDEETGDKRLLIESDNSDLSDIQIKDEMYKTTYFLEKIDDTRFVYERGIGGQWGDGVGIYDISDFSDHPIPVSDFGCYGICDEYLITAGSAGEGEGRISCFARTNINNFKTELIMQDIEKDYDFFHQGLFSNDGKLFFHPARDIALEEGISFIVKSVDVESQETIEIFRIYETNVATFWPMLFYDENTILVLEHMNRTGKINYILEIDVGNVG